MPPTCQRTAGHLLRFVHVHGGGRRSGDEAHAQPAAALPAADEALDDAGTLVLQRFEVCEALAPRPHRLLENAAFEGHELLAFFTQLPGDFVHFPNLLQPHFVQVLVVVVELHQLHLQLRLDKVGFKALHGARQLVRVVVLLRPLLQPRCFPRPHVDVGFLCLQPLQRRFVLAVHLATTSTVTSTTT